MNRSADSRRLRAATGVTAIFLVGAIAATAGLVAGRRGPGASETWELRTGHRLLDLFVGGTTPRFDEPEQVDAGALADALSLTPGPGEVSPGEITSARTTLAGILAKGGGLAPGSSFTGSLDDTWRSIRALAESGGVPPADAARSAAALSGRTRRLPRMSPLDQLLAARLASTLHLAAPAGGAGAECPDVGAIAAANRDSDARSDLRIGIETAALLGRPCPERPGSLSGLPATVRALQGDAVSPSEVSAVDDLTVLARLDPDLRSPAAGAVRVTLATLLNSYSRGERLTRLDMRLLRVLLDDVAQVPGAAPAIPAPVRQGAARLVRWRASFPDSVDAGGNVLTTVLGFHAFQLLRIPSPLEQVRRVLRARESASNWAASERWLLTAGLESGSMTEPGETVGSRYAGVLLGVVASGRSPCSDLPEAAAAASASAPAASAPAPVSAAGVDLVASAALLSARARCSFGFGDGRARAALMSRIGRSVADGDVVAVWQASEAACLATGRPPDLTEAMSRLTQRQVLPGGGVAAVPGGLTDVTATYAYLRLRVLARGCSPAWWSGL